MNDVKRVGILHLSDLHAGLLNQELLWPNLKEVLFSDIDTLHRAAGAWEFVLFSGDFAQKGLDDEFEQALARLIDLWGCFKRLGFNPQLICVPGNHDVVRPDPKLPEVRVLRRWFDEREIWEDFFADPQSTYRLKLQTAFGGYRKFLEDLAASSIPLASVETGIFPGDQITRLEANGISLGALTLNSTWLQLTGEDLKGRLAVDLRQAHALKPDLGNWCSHNHFNLIVTHHPVDWLHRENLEIWNREIYPAGRFDIHLFGHMHEPYSETRSMSGGATRVSMQAPSLFGMEVLGDGVTERIHGYTLLSFERVGDQRAIEVWPRRLLRHESGQDRFVPDQKYLLQEDRYFRIELASRGVDERPGPERERVLLLDAAADDQQERDVLRPLKYHLSRSSAHGHVRHPEQRQCLDAIESDRAFWLVAEWGLGGDEFLAAVLSRYSFLYKVFRLDAGEYSNMESFSKDIGRRTGGNFGQFCDALSKEPAVLILDDVPTVSEVVPGVVPVTEDVEALAGLLLDACPSLLVVMRTLRRAPAAKLACIQLSPLDEADIKAYVQNHDKGGAKLTSIDALSVLYRHTDGYPSRLDARLKEL